MDNKFVFLVLIFFLVFGSFATAVFLDQRGVTTRASSQCAPDPSTSILVSFPKEVPSGETCKVDVFVRCADQSVVTGAEVSLDVSGGSPDGSAKITDEVGLASFDVTGEGLATVNARVNGSIVLDQSVNCFFQ